MHRTPSEPLVLQAKSSTVHSSTRSSISPRGPPAEFPNR